VSPGRRRADKHATRNARGPGTASVAERVPRAQAEAPARRRRGASRRWEALV